MTVIYLSRSGLPGGCHQAWKGQEWLLQQTLRPWQPAGAALAQQTSQQMLHPVQPPAACCHLQEYLPFRGAALFKRSCIEL